MIDWKKSAELNNCTVGYLKARFDRFPGSRKPIVSVCVDCGLERDSCFRDHCDKCQKCANTIKNKSLDMRKKVSDKAIERWSDPHERDLARKRTVDFFIAHPEDLVAMLNRSRNYWLDQENIDALSETMRNSDAHKAASDKMRGGNDIVKHHFIYDHQNIDQHVVEITRSQHQSHHHWMRRNGLESPHYNVTEENINIFKRRS